MKEEQNKELGIIDPGDPHPEPQITSLAGKYSPALTGIFLLLLFYTLYFARPFLLPIVLAILLNFLLRPVVRSFKKLRIPESVAAGIVILALLAGIGYTVLALIGPAETWLSEMPRTMNRVESKLRELRKPVEKVTKAAESVEKMTEVSPQPKQRVEVQTTSFSAALFSGAWQLSVGALILMILLYFLLASGDMFLRKLIKVLPGWKQKRMAFDIAYAIENHISRYLLTITIINAALGTAVGVAVGLIGLPNAVLWGIMAALLNYIPYLGGLVGLIIMTATSLLSFPSAGYALLPPAVYLTINTLEAYLITPMILGRRLTLNPVVIFVGLIFWGWMWGIAGAFLAVPMIATFKILCDHIESLSAIGEFLGK